MIQNTTKKRKFADRCEGQPKAEKGSAVAHNAVITPETCGAHPDFLWMQAPPLIAELPDHHSTTGMFQSTNREKVTA